MSLMRYPQAWPAQARVHDDLKQIFDRFLNNADNPDESAVVTSQWVPRVDIKEEADRFVILADLPGVDPQQVEVLMDKGILSIKGERSSEAIEQSERFSRIERRYGSFHRRFALPDTADAEGIVATGHNGVLEVVIPKRAESTPRRIQVGSPTAKA
ncbi:MAG: Hsp20/alpha crystallin family protein [Xanthomonadales bacterium]|nr:Hsp20/alpha crystallin family protein [Xanthomonadales bacterium]